MILPQPLPLAAHICDPLEDWLWVPRPISMCTHLCTLGIDICLVLFPHPLTGFSCELFLNKSLASKSPSQDLGKSAYTQQLSWANLFNKAQCGLSRPPEEVTLRLDLKE